MTEESSKVEEETTDRNTDKKEYADLVEESILWYLSVFAILNHENII